MTKTKESSSRFRRSSSRGRGSALVERTSLLGEQDLHSFKEGTHRRLFDKLGAHLHPGADDDEVHFAVWAPNAARVSVIGDFNDWNETKEVLEPREDSGIWEGSITGLERGAIYKYHIEARGSDYAVNKADPFGFHHETPPRTGSIVWDLDYEWDDGAWMSERESKSRLDRPISIYEVHLGSWRTDDGRRLTYRELAPRLADYVADMGFTHVELMPVMEHPFYGSWGYQTTGFFAPTSRYGTPQDFMYLVDVMHQHGIGVILDWVPSHFPTDEHGLVYFDGTHLFEHADPRKGHHPDWDSAIFNYGRNEVRSFLLSSAVFWLDRYHADGLRVDAVASMLYLDYSRKEGEWIPNEFGGRENLEAIGFLRDLNEVVYSEVPGVQTYAEESTAWPMVSRPTYLGGLGFGLKWDMGFMHDTLKYAACDALFRKYHHQELTFRMLYAFNENFVLPFSHDEVVYGKGSLARRMAGADEWQKLATLRAVFGYMYGQPGKKLLFMGGELAEWNEWYHEGQLQWDLLEDPQHKGVQRWVRDLNRLYRSEPALHERDCHSGGFEWVDCNDSEQSIVAFIRRGEDEQSPVLGVFNFTPVGRHNYRLGVDEEGVWTEVLNSDAADYGGSGQGNHGAVETAPVGSHGREHALNLVLPPLSAVFFKSEGEGEG